MTAWEKQNPGAAAEDRARYARGDWTRHRKFFGSKEEAQAFGDSQETKISNEGLRGLALSDDLRVMAGKCAAKLKPYGYTIEQAVEHFIEFVQATRRSVTVAVFVPEYIAAKRQKGCLLYTSPSPRD